MAVGTQGMFFFSLMVMAMLMVHPGMGHVLLRGRQGSLQGCSCSDQARSTSQGIIILIIIFIKINNHHHQKLHLLWLFSKQSNKFTNHPGLLRRSRSITALRATATTQSNSKKFPLSFFILSNAPGSPAVSFNVRNPWGAEALAGWHSSGGVPHSTGAKMKKQVNKIPRCSGLMSLRRTWRENTGQQQETHFLY